MQTFPLRCLFVLALGAAPAAIAQENCVSGECAAPVHEDLGASMLQVKETVQSKAKLNATAVAVSKHRFIDVGAILTSVKTNVNKEYDKLNKAKDSWQAIMLASQAAALESKRLVEEGLQELVNELLQINATVNKDPTSATSRFFSFLGNPTEFPGYLQSVLDNADNWPEQMNHFFKVIEQVVGLSDNFKFVSEICDVILNLCDKITEELSKLADATQAKEWQDMFDPAVKAMRTQAKNLREWFHEKIETLEWADREVKNMADFSMDDIPAAIGTLLTSGIWIGKAVWDIATIWFEAQTKVQIDFPTLPVFIEKREVSHVRNTNEASHLKITNDGDETLGAVCDGLQAQTDKMFKKSQEISPEPLETGSMSSLR